MDSRPLRVAIVRARWNPYGGAERFVQRALAALAAEGVELTVIARRWDAGSGSGEPEVPVRKILVDPFHIGSAWRDAAFARAVRRAVAAERFDLVQSHERIPGLPVYRAGDGVHAEFLAQRARVLPWWRRAWMPLSPHHRQALAAERRLFAHPALQAVICNSRMVVDEIAQRFGVPAERLHLVRNGVDLERFRPPDDAARAQARAQLGVPAAAAAFAFVGSGFERKGLACAIRALARLHADAVRAGAPRPQAMLLVAGADRRRRDYARLAARLHVAEHVRFLGPVADVRPVLHACDVFVQPALYDPLPNAALEALACGLPVVTSGKSGAAELIEHGRSGWVVDALDVDAVAAGMRTLARSAAAGPGSSVRAAARAAVEPLSIERMGRELTGLYGLLTAGAARPPIPGLVRAGASPA